MSIDDIPEQVMNEIRKAGDGKIIDLLERCLRLLALAQRKADVKRIYSTLETNGDVTIATMLDSEGKSSSPYARIDGITGELGRELISTKPNSDGRKLDKCEIVGGELVVSSRDSSALLDLAEEPLDQITCAVQIGTEADRLAAIAFRRNICPCALLTDEGPDPVGVISSICQQHRSRPHSFE
jgi:hypothetical protein